MGVLRAKGRWVDDVKPTDPKLYQFRARILTVRGAFAKRNSGKSTCADDRETRPRWIASQLGIQSRSHQGHARLVKFQFMTRLLTESKLSKRV